MKLYIEIRNGVGGKDAEIFTKELMTMYVRFCEKNKLNCELVNTDKTKILLIEGKGRFINILKNESGVHKVQRIPETESKGRMQTSTATIATFIVDDFVETDLLISEDDFEYQYYKASGPGGQHRNKTESAVRLIHKPTKLVVTCANERSQNANKIIAKDIMLSKLKSLHKKNIKDNISNNRNNQIKNADRAESKRVYNYQRNIVFDNYSNKSATIKDILKKSKLELLA